LFCWLRSVGTFFSPLVGLVPTLRFFNDKKGMYGVYSAASVSNYFNGDVGFGTSAPEAKVDIKGANGYSQFRVREKYTPTSSADSNGF